MLLPYPLSTVVEFDGGSPSVPDIMRHFIRCRDCSYPLSPEPDRVIGELGLYEVTSENHHSDTYVRYLAPVESGVYVLHTDCPPISGNIQVNAGFVPVGAAAATSAELVLDFELQATAVGKDFLALFDTYPEAAPTLCLDLQRMFLMQQAAAMDGVIRHRAGRLAGPIKPQLAFSPATRSLLSCDGSPALRVGAPDFKGTGTYAAAFGLGQFIMMGRGYHLVEPYYLTNEGGAPILQMSPPRSRTWHGLCGIAPSTIAAT